jgi:PAS domain S-box-containing protein
MGQFSLSALLDPAGGRDPASRGLITIGVTCAATLAGVGLSNAIDTVTFTVYLGAVALSGWFGGPRWALGSIILSALLAAFFVLPPRYSFEIANREDAARLGVFVIVGLMIAGFAWVRERGETVRKSSEERLADALRAGGMGSWEWDVTTNRVTWSPELEAMHGLQARTFGGGFDSFLADVHPEDRDRVQQTIGHSLETGEHLVEYRIVRPDGAIRWVEGRGKLARNQDGTPRRMFGVCTDITNRKLSEEALRESEGRFRLLADGAPVLIWVNGLEGCEFVNRAYLDYLGRPFEELLGMGWSSAVHPDDYETYVGGYALAFEKRDTFEGQVRLLGADGQYRWFKSAGLPRFGVDGAFRGYVGSSADITDVRLAQEALAESEQRMRLASEAAQMGTWEWDMQTNRLSGSEQTAAAHGFSGSDFEGSLRTYLELIHPGDRQLVADAMLGSLADDSPEVEYRIKRPDGSERWVMIKGQVFRDAAGQPERMLGVSMDITERKQVALAAEESAALMSGVLNAAADAVITIDEAGRIASINPAGCRMFGYEQDELIGQNIKTVMPEPYASEHDGYLRRYQQTGEKRIIGIGREVSAKRRDGSVFPADLAVSEVNLDGIRIFTGFIRDITERRERDEGQRFLAEAGAVLASTLDLQSAIHRAMELAIPRLADMITIHLLDDSGQLWRAGAKHNEAEKENTLLEINRLYPLTNDPDHPVMRVISRARTAFLPAVSEDQIEQLARDRHHLELLRRLPLHSAIILPMLAHGRSVGAITLALDDPTRRWRDWDIHVAEGLAQRVAFAIDNARLYAESEQTREELHEANRAKDEFLAMMTHELRTPLTTLTSGLQLLVRRTDTPREVVDNMLEDMDSEAERLRLIVENLLTLSRVELDNQALEIEPLLLPHLIQKLCNAQNRARPTRPVEYKFEPGLPPAAGSPMYTELVLHNLIDNAQKYGCPEEPAEIRVVPSGDEIVVSVMDRGPGVAVDETEKIFERFYRAEKTARTVSGAGMGLAVSRRLAEAQGGRIWAEPREGGGLIVSLSLPVYSESGDSGPESPKIISSGQALP